MKRTTMVVTLGLLCPIPASAATLEDSLARLAPEYRAHQVCMLRGMSVVRREPSLRKADRMKTSILRPAIVEGTKLIAPGGAVRSAGHWYALNFSCDLTPDWTKATSFTYVLGREIHEADWSRLGLWR